MKKLLLILAMIIPCTSLAQDTCTDEVLDAVIACLQTDSVPNCLAANPGCDADQVNGEIATDVIEDYITDRCCARANRGKRLACLNKARASVRISSSILSADTRAALLEEIREEIAAVRETGQCVPDES